MAKGRSYNQIFEEYLTFGFDPSIIKIAYDNVKGDETKLLDQISKLQQSNNSFSQTVRQPINDMSEEEMIGKIIQESIDDAKAKNISFEPLNPQQRLRKDTIPVGLKNVGNTCYFNSLLQAYFYNPKFIKEVLSFSEPSFVKKLKDEEKNKDPEIKRKVASIAVVKNLQYLFAGMIASDKKYLDPTSVITSIVDDYGNDIPIGDQKDIGEFNLYFLSRVEEGIALQDKYQTEHKMEVEDKEELELSRSASKIGVLGQHNSEDSILKRSSIKVTLESIIGKQFFGKMETTFLNEKQGIKKSEEEMFTLLFVNVHHKELYTAFEEAIFSVIEDYRNDKGEIVTVEKQTWIKEPPKTLFFQIERVLYDKEIKNLKKIHDSFDFPKEFYIDPFIIDNKEKSLKIRKQVTKLRQTKVRLLENLRKLENYNDSNLSISKILEETISFLEVQNQQAMVGEGQEFSNPLIFDQVKLKLSKENVSVLQSLRESSEARANHLKQEIKKLESEIEKAYKAIRTRAPYQLQSILIHQGVADSGHYYSYSYDTEAKVWRKYNDINVVEEDEEQVMKLARGSGVTSAYYLVYTQNETIPEQFSSGLPLRNYAISSSPAYGLDVYSHYISKEILAQIQGDNHQLYHDIETHKAAGFLNKVIDTYTKRFEACNELSRKLKVPDQDKKKNSPPVLVNLPIYIKNIVQNDEEYKASILYFTSKEFGPKEESPVFDQLLKNKLTNLSDFKRPKKMVHDQTHEENFTRGVLACTLLTTVYKLIGNSEWEKTAIALTLIRLRFSKEGNSNNADYFTWISTVFSRVYILKLLIEIEKCGESKEFERGMNLVRIFGGFFSFAIPILQENSIIMNLMFWLLEISIGYPQESRPQMEQITHLIKDKKRMPEYQAIIEKGFEQFQSILNGIDINNQKFNFSRQEDTLTKEMNKSQEQVNPIMKSSNDLLREMKKSEVPFTAEQRNKFIK